MINPKQMRFFGLKDIDNIPQLKILSDDERFAIKVVSNVLPFRTNNYVIEELIDWDKVPNDPLFQLTFMQRGMLSEDQFDTMADVLRNKSSPAIVKQTAEEIRLALNPHPAGQMTINVPSMDEIPVQGMQHKYKETCLIFPSSGQTCHAYCTFCFRWAQFVGMDNLKFATDESKRFQEYIAQHKEVTDILLTGGDPMGGYCGKRTTKTGIGEFRTTHRAVLPINTSARALWPWVPTTIRSQPCFFAVSTIISGGGPLLIMISSVTKA